MNFWCNTSILKCWMIIHRLHIYFQAFNLPQIKIGNNTYRKTVTNCTFKFSLNLKCSCICVLFFYELLRKLSIDIGIFMYPLNGEDVSVQYRKVLSYICREFHINLSSLLKYMKPKTKSVDVEEKDKR